MATVYVDTAAAFYKWTYGSSRLAWSKGWTSGTVMHSANEPCELLQWILKTQLIP